MFHLNTISLFTVLLTITVFVMYVLMHYYGRPYMTSTLFLLTRDREILSRDRDVRNSRSRDSKSRSRVTFGPVRLLTEPDVLCSS